MYVYIFSWTKLTPNQPGFKIKRREIQSLRVRCKSQSAFFETRRGTRDLKLPRIDVDAQEISALIHGSESENPDRRGEKNLGNLRSIGSDRSTLTG